MRPSTIRWSAALGRVQAACYGQPPRQTLPLRLRRRGSRACPARHGARPTGRRGLQGHRGMHRGRPCLGPSALVGRRLAAATAGLRKASELFAQSCTIYSHNEPTDLFLIAVPCLVRSASLDAMTAECNVAPTTVALLAWLHCCDGVHSYTEKDCVFPRGIRDSVRFRNFRFRVLSVLCRLYLSSEACQLCQSSNVIRFTIADRAPGRPCLIGWG